MNLFKTVAALLSRFDLSDLKTYDLSMVRFFDKAFRSVTLKGMILLLSTFSVAQAEYFIKDEVIVVKEFDEKIDILGRELAAKTSWNVYMLAVDDIGEKTLVEYQKDYTDRFKKPYVLLALALKQGKVEQGKMDKRTGRVGIYGSEGYTKKLDREDILRGTLYPLLGAKVKSDPRNKYITVLYNGYAEIAEQIADSYDVNLENADGNTNRTVINIVKFLFYGMIIGSIAIFMYQKYYKKER